MTLLNAGCPIEASLREPPAATAGQPLVMSVDGVSDPDAPQLSLPPAITPAVVLPTTEPDLSTGDSPTDQAVETPGQGQRRRDRDHSGPRRSERVLLRVTPDQLAALDAASRTAGMSLSGFAAEAAVAAAAHGQPPLSEPLRAGLGDLIDARTHLRRLEVNVHLAVGAYHRDGVPPSWLRAAVEDAARAVARVDEAASAVVRGLR